MSTPDDIAARIRARRAAAGLTQGELAERAGVSRALVGALERGRHMPAADAAIRLARALDISVERLFAPSGEDPGTPVVAVLGDPLPDGALVRAARVGETEVARVVDAVSALAATGAPADGVLDGGRLRRFAGAPAGGAVVAGCDPVLAVAEDLLEGAGGARVVRVPATTGQALAALEAGRCHAALVHGRPQELERLLRPGLARWHVARWRSGIATHPGLGRPGLEALLGGAAPFVQRDRTAACQQAVERAARRLGAPRAAARRTAQGHLDAARAALEQRGGAVTIEPVAVAVGLDFTALEVHDVELWVPAAWAGVPGVVALLDLLATARFRDRAAALPAYDLAGTGAAR